MGTGAHETLEKLHLIVKLHVFYCLCVTRYLLWFIKLFTLISQMFLCDKKVPLICNDSSKTKTGFEIWGKCHILRIIFNLEWISS